MEIAPDKTTVASPCTCLRSSSYLLASTTASNRSNPAILCAPLDGKAFLAPERDSSTFLEA